MSEAKWNHRLKSVLHQETILPKKTSIEKAIRDLREEIQRHEDLYYLRDSPEISDREYDALIDKLRELEALSLVVLAAPQDDRHHRDV